MQVENVPIDSLSIAADKTPKAVSKCVNCSKLLENDPFSPPIRVCEECHPVAHSSGDVGMRTERTDTVIHRIPSKKQNTEVESASASDSKVASADNAKSDGSPTVENVEPERQLTDEEEYMIAYLKVKSYFPEQSEPWPSSSEESGSDYEFDPDGDYIEEYFSSIAGSDYDDEEEEEKEEGARVEEGKGEQQAKQEKNE